VRTRWWRTAARRALVIAGLAVIMVAASPVPAARSPEKPPAARQINCGITELVCRVAAPHVGASDASCPGARDTCDLDLTLYRVYMDRLSRGVKVRPLHPRYVRVLAPHYPGLDLTRVRLGYSPRQPLRNATTDCLNIYFNDAEAVARFVEGESRLYFRGGAPDPDSTHVDWLLHELRHAEQCMEAGGREGYARRWFQELSHQGLLRLVRGSQQQLHDAMEMEADADAVAERVLASLHSNVDARSNLAPALSMRPLVRAGPLRVGGPMPVILSASVEGGAEPLRFTWSMRRPGRSAFYRIPDVEGRSFRNQMIWTPSLSGTYRVRVKVEHPGGQLAPAEREYAFYVAPRQLKICSSHYTM